MAPDPSKGIPMSLKKRVMFSLISGGDEDSLGDRGGGMLSSLVRGPGGGVAPVGAGKEPDSECRETLTHAIAEHETNWDHGKALHESHFTDDVILQGVTLRDSDPIGSVGRTRTGSRRGLFHRPYPSAYSSRAQGPKRSPSRWSCLRRLCEFLQDAEST